MGLALVYLPLTIIALAIATAAYTLVPAAAYAAMALCIAGLAVDGEFIRRPLAFLQIKEVLGALLFNALFIGHSLFHGLEARVFVIHVLSLATFLVALGVAGRVFQECERSPSLALRVSILMLLSLLVCVAAQAAEVFGYLDRRDLGADFGDVSLIRRPGGFLNPNMTAAIAIIFFFVVERLHRRAPGVWLVPVAAVMLVTVLLTQSRAALLFLGAYLLMILWRRGPRLHVSLAIVALSAIAGWFVVGQPSMDATQAVALIDSITERFGGEGTADDRLGQLQAGVSAFAEKPLLGHGYRYLQDTTGLSSHNEVVESLVNYGIVGFVFVVVSFAMLYLPASPSFVVACVLPSLMFSHNFFETTALQAALGMALAADRFCGRDKGESPTAPSPSSAPSSEPR